MTRQRQRFIGWCVAGGVSVAALMPVGCMVGPNYSQPQARVNETWTDPGVPEIKRGEAELTRWWEVLNDPTLNTLVDRAYKDNPSLQAAGIRVLEAQAGRAIAVGLLFPQEQNVIGDHTWYQNSDYQWKAGLSVAWELDVWGKYRRGIEAADASVLASVANYDDVLVSLIAEVATDYILLRTLEDQLAVTRENVAIQQRGYELADTKAKGGIATRLDPAQAKTLLDDTSAQIPALEASIKQIKNTICILIGIPPQDISEILGEKRPIPSPPETVAVGVPAELLRRRPDIRRAERLLAAQCASIGIAKADFFPSFSLNGDIGGADGPAEMSGGNSFKAFGGPGVRWAIFNYGRIDNNVRVQDAAFQEQISSYESLVLRAQGEVENAIAGFLGARRQITSLASSVESATLAVQLAEQQYRGGITDYTRVLNTQQTLVDEQLRLISTRGAAVQNLITLYRALGGGWQIREGLAMVPDEIKSQMRDRTRWGRRIDSDKFEIEQSAPPADEAKP